KAYIAYAFICIIWGTTYLAIRVAVQHYPPFLMAGFRQVVSGIIMFIIALAINKNADLSKRNIIQQGTIGFLLITVGNGLVTWAEQYIQSGIAALICSTMPISAVIINIIRGNEKLQARVILGMFIGFSGVALIFMDSLHQNNTTNQTLFIIGIIALFTATFGWALGSILNKKNAQAKNGFFNSGLQIFIGGALMFLISPFVDNYEGLVVWNKEGMSAVVYLIIFGSVLAYAAYMYALKVLPVGFVTSYAYINPLVAVLLGSLMLNEALNVNTLAAFALIIIGIFTVRMGYKKQIEKEKFA
ncbi:MAG: EamA family transporter, partial [Chitinophagaceae bacterium]|nr:EamA family transporter [Chitinophagaceae bacterium]